MAQPSKVKRRMKRVIQRGIGGEDDLSADAQNVAGTMGFIIMRSLGKVARTITTTTIITNTGLAMGGQNSIY